MAVVRLERPAPQVARVVLARPEARNAIDLAVAEALAATLADVAGDADVRAVVIAGDGKTFCVGGDIRMMQEAGDRCEPLLLEVTRHVHAAVAAIATMPKPVIAAVRGGAGGGGLSLVAACDLAIVDEEGKFAVGFNALGLAPDCGGTHHLPRLVGLKNAMELAFLNEVFDGRRAVELGLANRALPGDRVDDAALRLAVHLAAGPTRAFAETKRLFRDARPLAEALPDESRTIARLSGERDGREGIAAFVEKRAPTFSGR